MSEQNIGVFGAVAIDIVTTSGDISSDVGDISKNLGGKGCNIAISLTHQKKGTNTYFLSAAESNYHLPAIRSQLKANKIEDHVMETNCEATNQCIFMPDGTSFTSEKLFKFSLPKERIEEFVAYCDSFIVTAEVSASNFKFALKKAAELDVTSFLLTCSEREVGRLSFDDLKVDYIIGYAGDIATIASQQGCDDNEKLASKLNSTIIIFDPTSDSLTISVLGNKDETLPNFSFSAKHTKAIGYQDRFCALLVSSITNGDDIHTAVLYAVKDINAISGNKAVKTTDLRVELNSALKNAAIDGLTGLMKRDAFEQSLPTMKLSDKHFVAMLDIDYFKKINDTHGHQVGDEVLKIFAQRINGSLKASQSTFVRWGGEEFVLILECKPEETEKVLTRILRQVNSKPFSLDNDLDLEVTFSIGYTQFESNFTNSLEQADKALYSAKNNGRNCIVKFDLTMLEKSKL